MKSITFYLTRFIFAFGILFQLSSCQENCDEEPTTSPLKENEKAFIQNQVGDTLHFKDTAGKKYFLICKSKELGTSGYYHTGHNNPCEDTRVKWEKLSANFEGSLPFGFHSRIERGYQPADPGGFEITNSCNSNYACFFYLIFGDQVYWGRTDENLYPVVMNFGFKSQITLGGRKFDKILTNTSSNSCLGTKPLVIVLDSIYYSTEFGLIRLTTTSGQKYQRVF